MTKKIIGVVKGDALLVTAEAAALSLPAPKSPPSTPIEIDNSSQEFLNWGDSNDYPNKFWEQCEKNSLIPSILDWKVRALLSGGHTYGYYVFENGRKKFVEYYHAGIEEFDERNDTDKYLEETTQDIYTWGMSPTELGLDVGRSKIVSMQAHEMMFGRFGKQNPKEKNRSDKFFIDANFPYEVGAETTLKFPSIDTYWNPIENIKKDSAFKYIYPLTITTQGKIFYQVPAWHSLIKSWLPVSNYIPQFKQFLMENSMSPKWIIHIPEDWWEFKHNGFSSMEQKERDVIMKKERDKFNEILTGIKQVGKTILATYKTDEDGKEYGKWEFVAVKQDNMSGEYIEDSQEASSHTFAALAVDPTIMGIAPGKGFAGSGSDKRVAWNLYMLNQTSTQRKVMKAREFVFAYNEFTGPEKQKLIPKFNNVMIATLDAGKEVAQNSDGTNDKN